MAFDLQLADSISYDDHRALETAAVAMIAAAERVEGLSKPFELCLRLTNDAEIRELNSTYRGRDAATDVLAFALREAVGGEAAPHVLGDIVVSLETATRHCGEGSVAAELVQLFAHGLCHLLGYDHQTDLEEVEMDARVAQLIGVANQAVRHQQA